MYKHVLLSCNSTPAILRFAIYVKVTGNAAWALIFKAGLAPSVHLLPLSTHIHAHIQQLHQDAKRESFELHIFKFWRSNEMTPPRKSLVVKRVAVAFYAQLL